ncbi:MAG: hypothetical protein KF766_14505 [Rhodocyclaceae bacterium]|nr:hypothetical protein [Rhodocyclaceae bacterium]
MSRLKEGEPFVTYGEIRDELQRQLNIERIFSTHIGHVAGCLMNSILKLEPRAPLINALITRPNGRPGSGVGNYFADRYKVERYRNWSRISLKEQEQLVEEERQKVLRYKGWQQLNERLFGSEASKRLTKRRGKEQDGDLPPVAMPIIRREVRLQG